MTNIDNVRESAGFDREMFTQLLKDIEMYARATAAFAVAEQPNGYDFGDVINQRWQSIRAALNHLAEFPDPQAVPDPFVDEARGIRELARADAVAIAAHPVSDWTT